MSAGRRRLGALAAVLAAGACASSTPAADAQASPNAASAPAESDPLKTFADLGAAFSRAYMANDLEAIADAYTEDAVALPPQGPIIRGREAIARLFVASEGVRLVHHRLIPELVRVEGDVAYEYGVYEVGTRSQGVDAPIRHGKYAVVWERGTDGKWRMAIDTWSPRPGPGE